MGGGGCECISRAYKIEIFTSGCTENGVEQKSNLLERNLFESDFKTALSIAKEKAHARPRKRSNPGDAPY